MGSGFAVDMIASLRKNRSLRNKKTYSSLKKEILKTARKENITFKAATKTELLLIREKMENQKREENRKRVLVLVVTFAVTAILLIGIAYTFRSIYF